MIKLILEIELHNKDMLIKELDHIGGLIAQDWPEGRGWKIIGYEEKELKDINEQTNEEETDEIQIID